MQQLTLAQLFGVNASQNSQSLVIKKADLPLLTPSSNNTAESLLIAILIKALSNVQGLIETENGNVLTDENGNPITFDNQDYYSLNLFRWQDMIIQLSGFLIIRNTIVLEEFTPHED